MAAATPNAGSTLLALFVAELTRRMREESKDLKAADLEVIRKFLSDSSVTLASVQRGDFGELAKEVADEFPFPEEGETAPPLQ